MFYIDRNGAVRIILTNGTVVTAGTIPVYTGQEFGLLGIALDPNFAANNWVYLYYSPTGAAAIDRIARYTMSGNTLQLNTATTILDVPTQRDQCCHAGGALEFDNDGNLYLATGDNTNPFDSSGYAPIDERPGRSAWDAQRTSANTNSLNGKVLRIKPLAAGGYSIPAGNLFDEAADTQQKTRPEIYAMGFRNPFRIGLDEQNNNLLVADYGPDAGSVSATRGPNGRVEWNVLDQPGNYGWPYCVGNNTPYNDYNFASSTAGATFDCASPVNDSPNNTGLTNLPPAKSAVIWQSNNGSITGTPEIGASGAPMTSGTYSYDPDLVSDRKWPAYFDSKAIWADWNNSRLFTVQMNADGTNYTDINRFLPSLPMVRPHALQFGPDGALYMIEWGGGFNGNNTDSGIYRIDYVEGNRAPVARVTTNKTSGPAPLTVEFDGSESFDADTGSATGLTFAWDYDGNGTTDATTPTGSHTYTTAGNYTARLTVTDEGGRTGTTNIDIVAGNTAPTVDLVLPLNGGFFEFGDTLEYEVTVTDPEDGAIDCNDVVVQPGLGHDVHSHDYEQYDGCSGSFPLPGDVGHVGANIYGTIKATYTDNGAGAAGPLTTVDGVVVHTKHKDAEFFDQTGRTGGNTTGTAGVAVQTTTDTGGGQNVTGVETGDWFRWDVMNLTGITGVTMRAASTTAGAAFEVRQGSPTGTVIGTLTVPNTGGAQTYQNVTTTFTGATTTSAPLYFVATTGGANVNWLEFAGRGITDNQPPTVAISASTLNGEAPLPVQFTSTVNDADGDIPVTYAWTFGDTTTSTEANPSHTYTTPGKYVVGLTATDARGAKTTKTLEVTVTQAEDICFSGRSDDFVGDALDTTRWNRSVRVDQAMTVANGTLNIPITATDIYQNTNTAPNIVLQDLPAGAFEITTKVTLPATKGYQQGGLIIYGTDNNYLKLVYSGRSTAAGGSKAANVIQFAKEVNATASESNSTALGATFPDTVWLRLSSTDGNVVTPTYSADGATWLPITTSGGTAAPRDLTSITAPKVGLLALGSTAASATPPITAMFDYFTITPDDTAVPCADPGCLVDTFDGNALGGDWNTVRPSGNLVVSGGSVKIPLEATDLYQNTNTARDLVLTDLPDGPFVATTKVSAPINRSYQQAGLLLYADDNNYIKHVFQGRSTDPNAASNIIQSAKELAGTAAETNTPGLGAAFPSTVWLRLTSTDGIQVMGSYSTDGETWTDMPGGYDLTGITDPKIGLLAAANTANGAGITATFEWFSLGDDAECEPDVEEPTDTTAPTTTLTIAAPPASGWYTTRPSFTLAAEDETGGSGVASIEYRIAGGAWTPYTAAVSVTGEGERLVEFRATDTAGNVEVIKSQTIKVDTVIPTAAAEVTGEETSKAVTLTATDATSGVASIEYQIDGATTWSTYAATLPFDEPGTYEVRYRATDVAGNISTVGTSTVVVEEDEEPADTTAPTTTLTIAAPEASGWYTTRPSFTLAAEDETGGSGVASIEYRIAGGAWTPYTAAVSVTGEGERLVEFRATDTAGNVEPAKSQLVKVDTVIPTVAAEEAGTEIKALTLTAADATSGVASIEYRIGSTATWSTYTASLVFEEPGSYVVRYRAIDVAGNVSAVGTSIVEVEEVVQAPRVSITVSPAAPNASGWYTSPVTVTLTGAGGQGSVRLEYRTTNGNWVRYTSPIQITRDGITLVQARARDTAGAISAPVTKTIKLDAKAPVLSVSGVFDGSKLTVAAVRTAKATARDATSGVASVVLRLNGTVVGSPVRIDAVSLLTGHHSLVATATDEAGNVTTETIEFEIVATYAGGTQLVQRLVTEDRVTSQRGQLLKAELSAAQRAANRGDVHQATLALARFEAIAGPVDDAQAKAALLDLAAQLESQL